MATHARPGGRRHDLTGMRAFLIGLVLGVALGAVGVVALRPPEILPADASPSRRESTSGHPTSDPRTPEPAPRPDTLPTFDEPRVEPRSSTGSPLPPEERLRRALEAARRHGSGHHVHSLALGISHRGEVVSGGTVRRLLAHTDPSVRLAGLVLAVIRPDPPVESVFRLAREDDSQTVRGRALRALAELAGPDGPIPVSTVETVVIPAAREETADVRREAIGALPLLGPAAADLAAELVLSEVLDQPLTRDVIDGLVRSGRAAPIMDGRPSRWVVKELAHEFADVLGDGREENRARARTLAHHCGAIAEGAEGHRLAYLNALIALGETEALARMARNHGLSVDTRVAALGALDHEPKTRIRGVDTALGLLGDDPSPAIRLAAADALANALEDEGIDRERLRDVLRAAAARDPNPWVRERAAAILADYFD